MGDVCVSGTLNICSCTELPDTCEYYTLSSNYNLGVLAVADGSTAEQANVFNRAAGEIGDGWSFARSDSNVPTYEIVNRNSDLVMWVSNNGNSNWNTILQHTADSANADYDNWCFYQPDGEDYYYIINEGSKLAISVAHTTDVVQYSWNRGTNQQFDLACWDPEPPKYDVTVLMEP